MQQRLVILKSPFFRLRDGIMHTERIGGQLFFPEILCQPGKLNSVLDKRSGGQQQGAADKEGGRDSLPIRFLCQFQMSHLTGTFLFIALFYVYFDQKMKQMMKQIMNGSLRIAKGGISCVYWRDRDGKPMLW